MKTIGLLGGMSWESTQSYYRALNEGVKAALGGLHSAKIVMLSVDFAEIEALQHAERWGETAAILGDAAVAVESAGADFLLICTNTMHKVADEVQARIRIPLLHIADATAEVLEEQGIVRVGLLGTRFTMEELFYRERLEARGIEVLVPEKTQRETVHQVIYGELCLGILNPASREAYVHVVEELAARGAQGVILGCTEIALLLQQHHTRVPLFDTAAIHAERAVQLAVEKPEGNWHE